MGKLLKKEKKLKEFLKHRTMEKYEEYSQCKIEVRKILRQKKKNNFLKFVEEINKNISMDYVWEKMNVLRNRKCVVNWNEWKDRNRGEEIKKEMKKLGRDWIREEEIIISEEGILEKANMELNWEFSEKKLDRVIRGVRTKSAPGRDGIDYGMIKELLREFKREILEIYNIFWNKELILDNWKEYLVFL